MVVKKDGRREPFDRTKIRAGIKKACEKRPISTDAIETVVDNVERACQEFQDKEIPSSAIGEKIMRELQTLDGVAYVRFASVYREFRDVSDFVEELKDLLRTRKDREGRKEGGIEGVHGNCSCHGLRPAPDAPGRRRPAGGRHLSGSGRRPDRRQHRRQRRLPDRDRPERQAGFTADVSAETLSRTTLKTIKAGDRGES